MEPSLYSPFLYSGSGPNSIRRLRPSWVTAGWIVAAAGLVLIVREIGHVFELKIYPDMPLLALVVAAISGGAVALLASRWLGRRVGTIAGFVQVACGFTIVAYDLQIIYQMATATVITLAILSLAMTNIPGRIRPVENRSLGRLFFLAAGLSYCLIGTLGPVCLILIGMLALLVSDTPRRIRYFADPIGWMILVAVFGLWWLCAGIAPINAAHHWCWPLTSETIATGWTLTSAFEAILAAAMPWTPFALFAIPLTIYRRGYRTPFWRLTVIWFTVPLLLVAIGLFHTAPVIGLLLPPVSIATAVALSKIYILCRRVYRAIGLRHSSAESNRWF